MLGGDIYIFVVTPCPFEEAFRLIIEEVPCSIVDWLLGPFICTDIPFIEEFILLRGEFGHFTITFHVMFILGGGK